MVCASIQIQAHPVGAYTEAFRGPPESTMRSSPEVVRENVIGFPRSSRATRFRDIPVFPILPRGSVGTTRYRFFFGGSASQESTGKGGLATLSEAVEF